MDNLMEVPQAAFNQLVSGGGVPIPDRLGGQQGDVAGGPALDVSSRDALSALKTAPGILFGGQQRQGQAGLERGFAGAQRQASIDSAPVGSVGAPGGFQPPPADPSGVPGGLSIASVREQFERNQAQQQLTDLRQQDEHPISTMVGRGLGDVATVFAGKAPLKGGLAKMGENIPRREAQKVIDAMKPGVTRAAAEVSNKMVKVLAPLARRTTETAAEGAALAALDDQDLKAGAGVGAGVELATAPVRGIAKFVVRNPGKAMLLSILATQILPFGQERILPAIEEAGDEAFLAMALGIPGAVATARFGKSGVLARNLPEVADLLTMIPRGSLTQLLTDYIEAPDKLGPLIQRFSTDPGSFGIYKERLENAIAGDGENVGDVAEEIFNDPKARHLFQSGVDEN